MPERKVGEGIKLGCPNDLKRAFARAFAGNLFYTFCQGLLTIALARMGSPEHLGKFGLAIAIAAPIVELFGLQLQVVESVDTKQKYRYFDYLQLQSITSSLALVMIASIAFSGRFGPEIAWSILAMGIAKVIEAFSLVCHGKMQQVERVDLIAFSLMLRGLAGLAAVVIAMAATSSIFWSVTCMAGAWGVVLLFHDYPAASALQRTSASMDSNAARSLFVLAWAALPLGIFVGVNSLIANAPRYFVEVHLGTRELGIFSVTAYLGLAARAFYTSVLNSALARLAGHHSRQEFGAFLRIIAKVGLAILCLGIAGCFGVYFFGKYVLWLFGKEYISAEFILLLLTASMACKTLWMLFVSALYAMKRFTTILLLQLMSGLILLLMLSNWVERFGLPGAAWAILLGSIFDVVAFSATVTWILFRNRAASVSLSLDFEAPVIDESNPPDSKNPSHEETRIE